MPIYNDHQQVIAERVETKVTKSEWKDWKWQMKHRIRDIDTFEKILGVNFAAEERMELEETINKFPLSVPPYYISLIDTKDYRNDPIYKQAFPSSGELIIAEHDMSDPLAEDKDSPAPGITHRYRTVFFLPSAICARCIAGTVPASVKWATSILFQIKG